MLSRRYLRNFDITLLLLSVALAVYGLVIIYSATHFFDHLTDPFYFVRRQAMWLLVGLGGIALLNMVDYLNYYYWARYIYAATVILLVLVLFIGRGSREAPDILRWIDLGFIDIQPSEYAKPVLILILARFLSDRDKQLETFWELLPAFLYMGLFMGLVFLQPDLGTSLVFVVILMGCFYVAGVKRKYMLGLVGAGLASLPLLWHLLTDTQKMRLAIFVDPGLDPFGSGYQLMQSIIAVGSGGTLGKGFFDGTQVQGGFIPEQHTDFIFSVLGEELGFAGAVILLALFFLVIYRILWIGSQAKDAFGAYVCCGVAVMILFQVMVNIGMTVGIMPVTGLPLPFISYGGNALLANFLSIGLVLNIGMRRQKIQF